MANINQRPPQPPYWPWGPRRTVRERLVDLKQLRDRQLARKKGDPKNPPLASAELIDFMGPGHSSDAVRLPPPPLPIELEAEVGGEVGLATLKTLADRAGEEKNQPLSRNLSSVNATPERVDRMQALLRCESDMLSLMGNLHQAAQHVENMRREETKDEGY